MKANSFWFRLTQMVPKKLVYFCGIRLWCHATTGKYSDTIPDAITMSEILIRWKGEDE